jgi:phenol 2-monooxygenase
VQFHLDRFRTGDPDLADPNPDMLADTDALPAEVDVLIVGCGPAGLTLAAQLAAFPDIKTRIVEQKHGPLLLGQADGVACRSMEMFEAFGIRERVEREAYWVNETAFWKPGPGGEILRHGVVQDVEEGLSPYPHVILNQARVHDFLLDVMRRSPNRLTPNYSRRFLGLDIAQHAVTARIERTDPAHKGEIETVRARYVVGCDGARSAVREALGFKLVGDYANQAWGVMDVLAVTDFPDIRKKCLIQSEREGNIILIPREGGYLVRIYVEMDKLAEDERVTSGAITLDDVVGAAQRVLRPYEFEVKEVAWWSVYEVGQRLTAHFDDAADGRLPRVFIAGDACHTHSAKAGQGMNVSMQDGFNLGWKLAAVLRGRSPASLLSSYSAERRAIAQRLIDFDREWSSMMAAPLKSPEAPQGVDPAELQAYFVQHGRYTAGVVTHYAPSLLTGGDVHQALAKGFVVGTRFHSAPVLRLADAKALELGETLRADGRFRLIAFAERGDPAAPSSKLRALCEFLERAEASPLRRHTPKGHDIDSMIDLRAVFQQGHRDLRLEAMPGLLLPAKGRLGLRDYEKMFCADPKADIFDLRGIDRDQGALVVVRPDQHVAEVLPLDGYEQLAAYFAGFMMVA